MTPAAVDEDVHASEQTAKARAIADSTRLIELPPTPTVQEALARVAYEVREVRKTGHNSSQNFNFRGIDAVVNAVGPAFRNAGVVCLPMVEDIRLEPMPLSGGKQATRVLVTVRYRFHGPKGDHLDAVTVGEAFDMGDKATAKAMSVAYRTCLLQALTIPTDDPDPDEHTYEQAPPVPTWNAGMAKQHVLNLAKGDKELAAEAWGALLAGNEWDPSWTAARLDRAFAVFMSPADDDVPVEAETP